MRFGNRKPFVYKDKFQLQMYELRTEFEQLFLKQQRQQALKQLYHRKLIRDVAYSYVHPSDLAKYILNKRIKQ